MVRYAVVEVQPMDSCSKIMLASSRERPSPPTLAAKRAGAQFVKTSTGFSKGGATAEDVRLMKENAENGLKVKAAGGIKSLKDAEDLILNGASRLGTSRIVKIVKEGNF